MSRPSGLDAWECRSRTHRSVSQAAEARLQRSLIKLSRRLRRQGFCRGSHESSRHWYDLLGYIRHLWAAHERKTHREVVQRYGAEKGDISG